MRIYLVCSIELGLDSGPSIVVAQHAEHLARLGNEVTLFAPMYGYTDNLEGVRIRRIRCGSSQYVSKLLYQVRLSLVLTRAMVSDRPDCLLVRHSVVNFGFFPPTEILNVPFVLMTPADPVEEIRLDARYVPTTYLRLFTRFQKRLFHRAGRVVVSHPALGRTLADEYSVDVEKVKAIGNGVDTDLFRPLPHLECKERLFLDPLLHYMTFVGHIQPWHGVDYVIRAIPHLARMRDDFRLLVVGDGPALPACVQLAQALGVDGFVQFVGRVPQEQVPYWLGASDVCLLPAKMLRSHPGDPIKMYEYIACGRPVLAANVEGYGEFVERDRLGKSADFTRPVSLARAMDDLLAADIAAYEARNRAYAVAHLRWRSVVSRINRVIFEVCRDHQAPLATGGAA